MRKIHTANGHNTYAGNTYFSLPNTDLSIRWLPGFVAVAASSKLQTFENKMYEMHFNFVNVSSAVNRLPSSFDCTIKTLERVAQLYEKKYGGCNTCLCNRLSGDT